MKTDPSNSDNDDRYDHDGSVPTSSEPLPLLPEKPKNTPFFLRKSFVVPFGAALIYGFLMRLSYGYFSALDTLSFGFLFFAPVALGAITVYLAGQTFQIGWFRAIVMPWAPAFIFLIGVSLVNLEVAICLIMASPIFFGATSIGGLVMNAILRVVQRSPRRRNTPISALLVAVMVVPYLVTGIENRTPPPDQYHVVDTQIVIKADARTVWDNIARVSTIHPEERSWRLSHLIGVPQPVEATLDYDGVGGVRHASFDNGLMFIETITEWTPLELIRFKIEVDPAAPLPAPFNALGGPFDVLDATYQLEPLPDGQILLHLSSTQRISTHINSYGSLWTEYLMADLQNGILEIIKARCER